MIGRTLGDIRQYIESLASQKGTYHLVCGRTGDPPVPATNLYFESRPTARAAARATEQYRAALRRYDPQVPCYDIIVCQEDGITSQPIRLRDRPAVATSRRDDWTLSEPVINMSAPDREDLVEFCHRVAGSVFETLSDYGHEVVESAIMDVYFDLAERLSKPDGLCLCLLESMAVELDQRLSPDEQATVLRDAAARLPQVECSDCPVSAALTLLEDHGLLGSYERSSGADDLDDDTRSIVVQLSRYALAPQHDRLPILPLVIELYRRQPDCAPSSIDVVAVEEGWQLTIVQADETESSGLASAPIQPKV